MSKIKVFEFKTIEEAESEFHKRIKEGCWQMVKVLKPVWSWRKWSYVFRFSMKKVEKPYRYQDYINDVLKGINLGNDVFYQSKRPISKASLNAL